MNATNHLSFPILNGGLLLAGVTMSRHSQEDDGKAKIMVKILMQSNIREDPDPVETPVAVAASLRTQAGNVNDETGHGRRMRWWTLLLNGNKCYDGKRKDR